MAQVVTGILLLGAGSIHLGIFYGTGNPVSSNDPDVQQATVGSVFLRTDGGSSSTLYVREPAGWVAK